MRSRGARVPATVVLLREVYTDTRGACGGSYGHDIYSPLVFDGCIKKRGMQQYKILKLIRTYEFASERLYFDLHGV